MPVFDIFLLEAVLNGLLFGGVLALLALGHNLIFGVIDVVWICYAELVMIGMYAVYFLYVDFGVPLVLAFAGGVLAVAVLVLGVYIPPALRTALEHAALTLGGNTP